MIRRLTTSAADFDGQLAALLQVEEATSADVATVVRDIIAAIRSEGDRALLDLTKRLDRLAVASVTDLICTPAALEAAVQELDPTVLEALQSSIARVRRYHEAQLQALGGADWDYTDADGNQLGQRIRGMDRVGVYAPGGKAAYPSTVIMTVIPARVAGVSDITLVVPAPGGELNPAVLAAAQLCGVDRVIKIGGAQAIAALAYGTESIAPVDKIVGPGNIYVATAKAQVFGKVGIDMMAGPSEVAIVADSSADPDWLVMDMFAQAEHDELAQAILVSWDEQLLDAVAERCATRLGDMPRHGILAQSIGNRAALIHVADPAEATAVINRIAPEHLELAMDDPDPVLAGVRFAGAIFIGHHTAEVMGDYSAGPSHVLPTSGTARFASPLGVYDFQTRSSLIACTPRGSIPLARDAAVLAEAEGLHAHAESAKFRFEG